MGGNIIKLPHEIILEQGELISIVSLVCRRLRQGDTPQTIREFIGEDSIDVGQICEIAAKYAPEFDVKRIIEDIKAQRVKK